MRVFVTGGTGLIGRALVAALSQRGDTPVVLSRSGPRARASLPAHAAQVEILEGDPTEAGAWQARISGCDAVVNLAGQPIGDRRWNAQVRQILRDSRIDSTRNLVAAIAAAPAGKRPRVLVSASGVDYYPLDLDLGRRAAAAADDGEVDEVDEHSTSGDGFLAALCREWEQEARAAEALGVRVVCMRTGLVIGEGSAIDRWARAFRWFAGGKLGSGRQWVSWIHLDDVIGGYLHALDTASVAGPVNLVAPGRLRNRDFARELGRALHRPSLVPTPAPVLRAAVGEMAEYLLRGRAVVPRALLASGYVFRRATPFG